MSPERPGGGDGGSDRPGDAPVGRGEDPVDVDAAWADIVARWGDPAADRGTSPAGGAPGPAAGRGTDAPTDLPTDARRPAPGTGPGTGTGTGTGAGDPAPPGAGGLPGRRVVRGRGEEGRPVGGPDAAEAPDASDDGDGTRPAGWADDDGRAPAAWRSGSGSEPDEDHYVPPEPPRSPPSDTVTRLAWAGALAGPALLLLCALVWRDAPTIVVAAAVAAFVVGFGVLVARLPRSRDDDDGAVV